VRIDPIPGPIRTASGSAGQQQVRPIYGRR
jgi:hypothetical protein